MFSDLLYWLADNSTPLLFTALTIQLVCWWASSRGVSLLSVFVPSNLSLLLMLAADATVCYAYEANRSINGLICLSVLWLLYYENKRFYRLFQRRKVEKQAFTVAAQVMPLLAKLFAAGKLKTLDSETTMEREKPLIAAFIGALGATRIVSQGDIWRLDCADPVGTTAENLRLCVVRAADRKEDAQVPYRSYSLKFNYYDNGNLKNVAIQGGALGHGHLRQIVSEGNDGAAYWGLRD